MLRSINDLISAAMKSAVRSTRAGSNNLICFEEWESVGCEAVFARVFLRRPCGTEQIPVDHVLKRCLDQPVSEQFEELQRVAVLGPMCCGSSSRARETAGCSRALMAFRVGAIILRRQPGAGHVTETVRALDCSYDTIPPPFFRWRFKACGFMGLIDWR